VLEDRIYLHFVHPFNWMRCRNKEFRMKTLLLCVGLVLALPRVLAQTTTFDSDTVGKSPAGWQCGATGKGSPRWSVVVDGSAPSQPHVLSQAGVATFPWCVRNDIAAADGTVEVKFKPVSGKDDQAGGVVWCWKDGENYYVARANTLENNVALYYTENGSRKTIKYVNAPVALEVWHTLRVHFKGELIQVVLDGKATIETNDRHITGAGKAGVWTKADSVTLFDDFSFIESARK
jgi:hypothetical protein